tara:strand:+ start:2040 stop:2831 length:792 start_codon:yes stop_codon:yes gene_type:complete
MKNLFFRISTLVFISFTVSNQALAWGAKGHRIIGEIAQRHLDPKVLKKVDKILQGESLAICSTWMDHIKSNDSFNHMYPWHYCTIPNHKEKYEDGNEAAKKGDIILTIERLLKELSSKNFTDGDERMAIRMIAHLVGDIHQPLHVGNGEDRGGNDLKIKWFGKKSNLHRIWDSELINYQDLSYTEYTNWINKDNTEVVRSYQNINIREWALESKKIRMNGLYPDADKSSLGYDYNFKHVETLNSRLFQAGVRLAQILNTIYKN